MNQKPNHKPMMWTNECTVDCLDNAAFNVVEFLSHTFLHLNLRLDSTMPSLRSVFSSEFVDPNSSPKQFSQCKPISAHKIQHIIINNKATTTSTNTTNQNRNHVKQRAQPTIVYKPSIPSSSTMLIQKSPSSQPWRNRNQNLPCCCGIKHPNRHYLRLWRSELCSSMG